MEKFVVTGKNKLKGVVEISGAKNAAVAIIPSVILTNDPCIIENVPDISDVSLILHILNEIGVDVQFLGRGTWQLCAKNVSSCEVPYEMAKNMRASYYLLGSLLGRFYSAKVSMPGGCDFGVRPIDQHIKAFESMGAVTNVDYGMIDVRADRLSGSNIYFDLVSVGATVNTMLASVRADGLTIIENAAKEPHIVDLANFLNSMGADVRGAGTDVIKVRGVKSLHGATYSIIPDQIEAGTYMAAAAATGGDVLVKNVIPKHLESITAKLSKMGVNVEEFDESVRVWCKDSLTKTSVKTMPHPGFPTDMQPQITAVLATAAGTSMVTEGVWDNRFKYVDELRRMGANIQVDGKVAVIEGVERLTGAPVRATDLRAGAALMIAALSAEGTSEIEDIYHIERGYENISEKLTKLGADIQKIHIPDEAVKQAL